MNDSSNSQSAARVRAAAERLIAELEKLVNPTIETLRRIAQMDIPEAESAQAARTLDNLAHDMRKDFDPVKKAWREGAEQLERGFIKAAGRKERGG